MAVEWQVYSNWGKWGAEDERGALNYITPEVVRKAAGLVRTGRVYSLCLPIQRTGVPIAGARNTAVHLMALDGADYLAGTRTFGGLQAADDYIFMATHGTTHTDALAHAWYDNRLYNGFDSSNVRSSGARRCGVDKIGWIFTRGVLLDVAGYRGVDHLPASYVITPEELEAVARWEGVTIEEGDALLIRTGWLKTFQTDPETFEHREPGIGVATIPWIYEHRIAVVASDNVGVEVMPSEIEGRYSPVHMSLLRDQGVLLQELLDLEDIARDRVYEFLYVAAPLRIRGGVGSPLNPLAVC